MLTYLLIALTGVFIFVFNNRHSLASWLLDTFISSLVVFGLELLIGLPRYREQVTIAISGGNISGPSTGWLPRRHVFPLGRLDTSRTKKQTRIERWLGYKYIWSVDGSRICIEPVAFEQAQVNAILDRIGL